MPGDIRGRGPFVSVIIPNYDGMRYIPECLESLSRQTFSPFELIVVDNGSTDGSVDFIRQNFPSIKLILLERNYGFSRAVNTGIRASLEDAKVKYVVLLNNDTAAGETWLEELVRGMEDDSAAGFGASKILFYDRPDTINSAGDIYGRDSFPDHRGVWQRDNGQFDSEAKVFGASAAAAIYRRSTLEDTGLFDEDFFAYCEDVDLSFRAQLKGYGCRYIPRAVVYHRGSSTGRSIAGYYVARNSLFVLIKNMPTSIFIKYLPKIIFSRILYLLRRKDRTAQLKALFAGLWKAAAMAKKRRVIQRSRRASDGYIESILR